MRADTLHLEIEGEERTERARPRGAESEVNLLPIYLREMGATPLLTRDEEVRLASELKEARESLARLVQQLPKPCIQQVLDGRLEGPRRLSRWPLAELETCYERVMAYDRLHGDARVHETLVEMRRQKARLDRARDALTVANLRLVTHIVKGYSKRGIPNLDLIQEGNIGLMKAVEKFEHEKGYKFSTYAYWWIKQAINRAIADKSRTIRIPVHLGEKLKRIQKVHLELGDKLGREPTPQEVAKKMRMPLDKLEEIMELVEGR
jgi:RNA polymerase primary sigma factor